jgi:hypothetical protein
MTANDAGELILGLGILFNGIAALIAAVQSFRNGRALSDIHKATNSMKDALVASTDKEAFARGIKAGEASTMSINHRGEAPQ